jgi:predicted ATPase
MRISYKNLSDQANTLNQVLGRPTEMFGSKIGEHPMIFNEGHFLVDSNGSGYQLEEQLASSGTVNHTDRLTAKEMSIMLKGMIKGAYTMRRKTEGK